MRVLVLNAGSSTLKWSLLQSGVRAPLESGTETWTSADLAVRDAQVRTVLRRQSGFDAVGHRVVHGGTRFHRGTLIDRTVRAELEDLAALDRVHMRPALAGIDAVTAECPELPQVAAFDTAFHAALPAAAAGYALPHEWTERWNIRRFGFHGLSVQYSLDRTRELLGRTPSRMIVCHLGSGCSVTAVADGRSRDTTMGFTPLEGVMMATRSGSIDPGLLLFLQARCGIGLDELRETLASRSGLLGVSGVSSDLRKVIAAADEGNPRARLAYDEFIWTVRRAVGAMAGVLEGVDALVFTGGIGENSDPVRRDVSAALGFAGLRLEPQVASSEDDRVLSSPDSRVSCLLVHAREDLVVLREVERELNRAHERDDLSFKRTDQSPLHGA